MRETDHLQALGKKTEYRSDYAPEVLETFQNKHPENDYLAGTTWRNQNENYVRNNSCGNGGVVC